MNIIERIAKVARHSVTDDTVVHHGRFIMTYGNLRQILSYVNDLHRRAQKAESEVTRLTCSDEKFRKRYETMKTNKAVKQKLVSFRDAFKEAFKVNSEMRRYYEQMAEILTNKTFQVQGLQQELAAERKFNEQIVDENKQLKAENKDLRDILTFTADPHGTENPEAEW